MHATLLKRQAISQKTRLLKAIDANTKAQSQQSFTQLLVIVQCKVEMLDTASIQAKRSSLLTSKLCRCCINPQDVILLIEIIFKRNLNAVLAVWMRD